MQPVRQRQPPLRSRAHLDWIRTLPCAVPGCFGAPMHAHHVRLGTDGGTALKPSDSWAVPLCATHHRSIDDGPRSFDAKHGLDLRALAQSLAAVSPALSGANPL